MLSISPLRNSTFSTAALPLVLAGKGKHLVRHVQAVGFASGPHALRGKKHVDATAAAQVEDGFSGLQFGQCRRIAAPQRGENRSLRQLALLADVIQIRGDRVRGTAR